MVNLLCKRFVDQWTLKGRPELEEAEGWGKVNTWKQEVSPSKAEWALGQELRALSHSKKGQLGWLVYWACLYQVASHIGQVSQNQLICLVNFTRVDRTTRESCRTELSSLVAVVDRHNQDRRKGMGWAYGVDLGPKWADFPKDTSCCSSFEF